MQFRVSLRSKAGLVTSADIANSTEVQNRRWIWNQSLFCRLWLRFPTPWTLKGRLVHVRTGKQEKSKKKGRKERGQEMRICRKLLCCPFVWGSHGEPCHRVAYGIQPARTHLYDRSLLLCGAGGRKFQAWLQNGKMLGPQQVWFNRMNDQAPNKENWTACATVQTWAGTFSPLCCLVFVGQDRQS